MWVGDARARVCFACLRGQQQPVLLRERKDDEGELAALREQQA